MGKKTGAKSALKPTTMRVPAHGVGQLRVGNPGCAGGTGRPPNKVRELAREKVYAGIPHIAKLMTEAGREADQIAAFMALARLGVPNQVEVGENPEAPLLTDAERAARVKGLLEGRGA